jgi:PAS domain S-box-containing protein
MSNETEAPALNGNIMTQKHSGLDDARRELYELVRTGAPAEEKVRQMLELGEEYLGVENGHLTRVDPASDYWEAIASTDDPDGEFPPGEVLDFETTYCRRAVDADGSIALHDAPAQGWDDDVAFETHGLHCYHGTPIYLDGELYGTVCFVATEPRDQPFDEGETLFAELIARTIEHEFGRRRYETEARRRANLVTLLSRVLRHNVRNGMTVIRGRAAMLADDFGDMFPDADAIIDRADTIIEISEKARKLETVVTTEFAHEETDLASAVCEIVREIRADHPAADISVDTPTECRLPVMASAGAAVRELIENAAKHAGDAPTVAVTVESTERDVHVHVRDDGPGLPAHEAAVLEDGEETPLVHGSGLGLWLVHWIVSSHGGTITTDVSEEGTEMTVSLPRDGLDPATTEPEPSRQLRRGYDRFRLAFDEALNSMLILDDDGRVLTANTAAGDLYGRHPSELLGRPVESLFPEELTDGDWWESFNVGSSERETVTWTTSEGDERVVEYTLSPDIVRGQHLLIGHDVTERERRKRELGRRTEYLDTIFDVSPVPIVVFDTDGRVERWNQAATDTFGWTESDVRGEYPPMVPPAEMEAFQARFQRLLDDGGTEIEVERETRAGEQLTVSISAAPISNSDGEVVRVVAVFDDLTQQLKREQALTELSEQLDGVLDAVPAAVFVKNDDYEYVLTNDTAREILDLPPEETVTGKTDDELFSEAVAASYRADDEYVFETGEVLRRIEDVPGPDGTTTHLTIKQPITDDAGSVSGICGVSMTLPVTENVEETHPAESTATSRVRNLHDQ